MSESRELGPAGLEAQGALVGPLVGPPLNPQELVVHKARYMLRVGGDVVDGRGCATLAHLANAAYAVGTTARQRVKHATEYGINTDIWGTGPNLPRGVIKYAASRKIAEGDLLTVEYGDDYWWGQARHE